tara:strand:- start:2061 stop:2240 length:180 start_codon:yes stop_codon:yes gene_type:complete
MAAVIESDGVELELRRQGHHAFNPDEFSAFLDQDVEVTGWVVEGAVLFVETISINKSDV